MNGINERMMGPDLLSTAGEIGEMLSLRLSPAEIPDTGMPGTGIPRNGERTLAVQVVTTEDDFSALRDVWNALAAESQSTIFQTFDWQFLWWKHYKSDPSRSLRILVLRDQDTVVGIFPLFHEQVKACGVKISSRLRMLGCGVPMSGYPALFSDFGVSDYLSPLILPGYHKDICAGAQSSSREGWRYPQCRGQRSVYAPCSLSCFQTGPGSTTREITPV